jgi:hypothetical protein
MLEQLLVSGNQAPASDDSNLPFPAGTPFKGVVSAKNFITGSQLASQIGLTAGVSINSDAGWLHFVEDNGYNIYIAKKPLRAALTWPAINTAQTGKEIIIGGKTFLVEFMTGMKANNLAASNANGGGAWDRYIYNVYAGERANQLPATRENWGSYTEKMLGIPLISETQAINTFPPGGMSYMKEIVTNTGHAVRGLCYPITNNVPNVMGVWYTSDNNTEMYYGWRPMLVEKGTTPPVPVTPYKGLVQPEELINVADLSTLAGVTVGTVVSGAGAWMKFVENGKELYIAQKSFRDGINRSVLNAAGISNTADGKLVTIGGKNYKCRLMTDAEWNRYMYSVYDNSTVVVNTNFWAAYNNTDLCVANGAVRPGVLTHVYGGTTRGFTSIQTSWAISDTTPPTSGYGWRPVLELVP